MWSLEHTPQAFTLMRTWPGPGVGISRSSTTKSAPGLGTTAIFIFGILSIPCVEFQAAAWMQAPPRGLEERSPNHVKRDTGVGLRRFVLEFSIRYPCVSLEERVAYRDLREFVRKLEKEGEL